MRDPESARFTHGHFRRGYWQEFLGGRHWGYIGCGTVNAKNGFGGYAGASAFVSVYHKGRVIFADVDSEAGGIVQMQCSQGGFNVR